MGLKLTLSVWAIAFGMMSSAQNLTDSLVAYFPLNGHPNDIIGSRAPTSSGGAPGFCTDRLGNSNGAACFDGASYWSYGNVLDVGTSDFTLAFWMKVDTVRPPYQITQDFVNYGAIPVCKGTTGAASPPYSGYSIFLRQEQPGVYASEGVTGDATSQFYFNTTGASLHQWTHVAFGRSGTDQVLYINGVLINSTTTTVARNLNTNIVFSLGAMNRSPAGPVSEWYQGALDELRMYKGRCLSPTDIAMLAADNGLPFLSITPRVLLEGPFVQAQGLMRDDLRQNNLLPLIEPFTATGVLVTTGSNSTISNAVLSQSGPNAIVDWVLLQLRDPSSPATIVSAKPALLQRDGDVVALDGTAPVVVQGNVGLYQMAIHHRNHLGVMTSATINLTTTTTVVDFSAPGLATFGTNARKQVGTLMVLWAGDATGNGILKYTGTNNDRDPILVAVGGTTPNNALANVYDKRDTNLDGLVKYTGTGNDRDIILVNVGSTTPNNSRWAELP